MPRKVTPHLSDALQQYLEIRSSHLSKATLMNDTSVLRRFVEGVGDRQVHLLTAPIVERYFATEAKRQKASSYNKVVSRTRAFLGFCSRRQWLDTDPLGEVRPRRVERPERLQLRVDQMIDLLERTDLPRDKAMLSCALGTGLRASDLTALTVGSVDLDGGWLSVQVKKTGRFDRMPITAELDQALREWLTIYTQDLAGRGIALEDEHLLFPAMAAPRTFVKKGEHVQVPGALVPTRAITHPARIVQRALTRIGIQATRAEGWHTIRRSVGLRAYQLASEQGQDQALRLVAALLGHSSVATVELYIGVTHDRLMRDELLRGQSFLGTRTVTTLASSRPVPQTGRPA